MGSGNRSKLIASLEVVEAISICHSARAKGKLNLLTVSTCLLTMIMLKLKDIQHPIHKATVKELVKPPLFSASAMLKPGNAC